MSAPDLDVATVAAELLGLDADDPVVGAVREAVARKRQAKVDTAAPSEQPPGDDGFADFDAHFAARAPADSDQAPKPIRIRLYGRLWHLGMDDSPPAAATLRLGRLAANDDLHDVDLTDPRVKGEVLLLAADLIPKPVLDVWLAKGLDTDQLGEICLWTFGQYRFGAVSGGGDKGEAAAPEAGASDSSSNGGRSSSPTSTASTASTSTPPGSSTG